MANGGDPMSLPGHPRNRHDECVSYREMDEYFAREIEQYHAIRAESYIQMGRELEKIEGRLGDRMDGLAKRLHEHDEYHRNVLQAWVDRATSNRTAIISTIVAAISAMVSAAAVVIAAGHHA